MEQAPILEEQKIEEPNDLKDLTQIQNEIEKEKEDIDKLVGLAESWLSKAFTIFENEENKLSQFYKEFETKLGLFISNPEKATEKELESFESTFKQHLDMVTYLVNGSSNIFDKLIKKNKKLDNKEDVRIKEVLDKTKGIRYFYTNIDGLFGAYVDILNDLEKITKQTEHKDIGEQDKDYFQNVLNNFNQNKEFRIKQMEQNKKVTYEKSNKSEIKNIKNSIQNEQDNKKEYNKEQENIIQENKENDKAKNVVHEAEKENKDQKKDQPLNNKIKYHTGQQYANNGIKKENKIIITEQNEKKKSKFIPSKYFDKRQEERKQKMKDIRDETRERASFDYDRYRFYEDKYIKKFSYLDPIAVANYQFRDLSNNKAFNTKLDKKNDKPWRWGVWTNL